MKIKWLIECEIEVCHDPDTMVTEVEIRKPGMIEEAKIIGYAMTHQDGTWKEDKNFPQLQFEDKSVTLAIQQSCFEEVK